jgi:predicted HAD superfamily phosphohydrolase YqeG
VVFVDVDDTLVRSAGTKRVPIPHVVEHVRELWRAGAALYLWSRGGEEYARAAAAELDLADCFEAFLPKPNVILDDEELASWRGVVSVHPASCRGRTIDDYETR